MRKKELVNQNMSLFEEIQRYKLELTRLNKTINEKDNEIKLLKEEINSLKVSVKQNTVTEETVSEESIEETTGEVAEVVGDNTKTVQINYEAQCDADTEYGAGVIGELVIASAKYSNKLTENADCSNRELLNLILGRNEVAKSEILTIVSSDDTFEQKKAMIDEVKAKTLEYFESVMAQIS